MSVLFICGPVVLYLAIGALSVAPTARAMIAAHNGRDSRGNYLVPWSTLSMWAIVVWPVMWIWIHTMRRLSTMPVLDKKTAAQASADGIRQAAYDKAMAELNALDSEASHVA